MRERKSVSVERQIGKAAQAAIADYIAGLRSQQCGLVVGRAFLPARQIAADRNVCPRKCNSIALTVTANPAMFNVVASREREAAVFRRYRALIAACAVALQAMDGVVGALGHSHDSGPAICTDVDSVHVQSGGCSHHHHNARPAAQPASGSPHHSPQPSDHDDCSLCRHFNQPAAPVTLATEAIDCERVEIFVPALIDRLITVAPPAHPARGPPALSA
jgi:hypothetical protein